MAVMLVGCGTDHGEVTGEVTGRYRVVDDVASRCAVDQPVMMPVAYVEITPSEPGIGLARCPEASTCSDVTLLPMALDDGWSGGVGRAQTYEGGRICMLGYTLYEAQFSGDALVLDITSYATVRGAASCTVEEAIAAGTSMDCATHERIDAVR